MSIRAPRLRDPGEHATPEEHVVLGHWEPSRWWRVICEEKVLAESSNPDDCGMAAAMTCPHAELQRSWHFIPSVVQWHTMDPPYPAHVQEHKENPDGIDH